MNIHKNNVERITITGPKKDLHKAFRYCEKNGFCIVKSEPMLISFGKIDRTQFKIVAEREVTHD